MIMYGGNGIAPTDIHTAVWRLRHIGSTWEWINDNYIRVDLNLTRTGASAIVVAGMCVLFINFVIFTCIVYRYDVCFWGF